MFENISYSFLKKITAFCCLIFVLLSSSCSNTKYLKENQTLLYKNKIKINGFKNFEEKRNLEYDLLQITGQQPNTKSFIFFNLKTLIYNKANQGDTTVFFDTIVKKEKNGNIKSVKLRAKPMKQRIKRWLRNKVGEPPVLYDSSTIHKAADFMKGYLRNKGYFHVNAIAKDIIFKKRATVQYSIFTNQAFLLKNINYISTDSNIVEIINNNKKDSHLKSGQVYDIINIKLERARIVDLCRDNGYFNFNQDFVYFEVDTSQHQINIDVILKSPNDSTFHQTQIIKKITVNTEVSLLANTNENESYTSQLYNGIAYLINEHNNNISYKTIDENIFIRPNDIYSYKAYKQTYNRLSQLGVFRYVNITYKPIAEDNGALECVILLTQNKRNATSAEMEASTGSDYVFGSAITLTYRNRSLFRGGEQFSASIQGGIELRNFPLSDNINNVLSLSAKDISAKTSIYFPKIIFPFYIFSKEFKLRNPKTKLSMEYVYTDRINFFTLRNLNGKIGYEWLQNQKIKHTLDIAGFTYIKPDSINYEIFIYNDYFLRSIEKQVILGSGYTFNYFDNTNKKNTFSAQLSFEIAGNTIQLINQIRFKNKDGYFLIMGIPYAQFARVNLDLRKNIFFAKFAQYAIRFNGGIGYAFGNSLELPFIRQFFAGGTNSLRAWRVRSIGPGEYPSFANTFDNTGDVKLEFNIEQRFPLYSVMKGALFTDIGNVWNIRENPNKSGGVISTNMYKQLAWCGGVGFRFDFTYFILRLDLAVPFHDPRYSGDETWQIKHFLTFKKQAIKDLTIVNLAIGYPF